MRRARHLIAPLALFLLLLAGVPALPTARAQPASGPIYTVEITGVVSSVTTGYLRRALRQAEAADASLLLIELGAGGAVLAEARAFAGAIAQARVPVAVYIGPAGAQAGAAGALFLSAAHIAALAPDAGFGSPDPLGRIDATLSQQTRDLVLDSVTEQIRGWNAAHGRNTAWVERAVREGVLLNSAQAFALDPPAVDLVAANRAELLTLLEGRSVRLADGRALTLATLGRPVLAIEPTLWERLRLALADPTIAFVLLVLGVIAICMEFAAPGTTAFAGLGAVLLLAAALGLLVLPLRWWALGLLVVALALLVAEFAVHAHGALAISGIGLLAISALNLIDPAQAPGIAVALWAVVLVGLMLASLAAFGVWLALRSRARPAATGREAMVGKLAEVRQRLAPEGMVFVEGALWQAILEDGAAEPGEWVRVAAIHDLRLVVRRIDDERSA